MKLNSTIIDRKKTRMRWRFISRLITGLSEANEEMCEREVNKLLMVKNVKIAGDDLVIELRAFRDAYFLSVVCDNYDGPLTDRT